MISASIQEKKSGETGEKGFRKAEKGFPTLGPKATGQPVQVGLLPPPAAVGRDTAGEGRSFNLDRIPVFSPPLRLQRKSVDGEGKNAVGGEPLPASTEAGALESNAGMPQGGAAPSRVAAASVTSTAVHEALHTPGKPLDREVRNLMEPHFRQDFSHVRIHDDERAAGSAGRLHASAFTLGGDIVFARNRYQPSTPQGRLLLLHELKHVAQQRSAAKTAEPQLDPPGSPHERQASSLLDPGVKPLPVQRIQRSPDGEAESLGGRIVDSVGESVFGKSAWPFLKAVFEGFLSGFKKDVKEGRASEAAKNIAQIMLPWNAPKFYGGYLWGLVIGLVSPITDLVKGIIGIVRLAVSALEWLARWSPAGIAASPERQKKIANLIVKFSALAVEWNKALTEFRADPVGTARKLAGFFDNIMQMALGKAREIGANAAHSIFNFLAEKDYFKMGKGIGEVVGALVAQILLVVFTDAIGNLITKGASLLGKAAEFAAGKAVEIFAWVKEFVSLVLSKIREAVKGALKMFEGLVNKAAEAFEALRVIFIEASDEMALGEKALAGGKALGKGAPTKMEARMLPGRTSPAKVGDLTPPKVHPSKALEEKPKLPEAKKELAGKGTGTVPEGMLKGPLDPADKALLERHGFKYDEATGVGVDRTGTVKAFRNSEGLWTYSDGTKTVTEYRILPHYGDAEKMGSKGFFQAHHPVQDKWAETRLKEFGYRREDEPSILLRDSYKDSPHQRISARQGNRKSGISSRTYAEERRQVIEDLKAAGVPENVREKILGDADAYFRRIMGNIKDPVVRDRIFGDWR